MWRGLNFVEKRILTDGKISKGDILKVDGFLNHQLDINFLYETGREFYNLFKNCGVSKIVTIESSGIIIAGMAAQFFSVPVVFAKKSRTKNISGDVYTAKAESYTRGDTYDIVISKEFLSKDDRVLIVDDFLAKGNALKALIDIIGQAGAKIAGVGIVIEKAYQGGGDYVRSLGIKVESLAKIVSMSVEDGIVFG